MEAVCADRRRPFCGRPLPDTVTLSAAVTCAPAQESPKFGLSLSRTQLCAWFPRLSDENDFEGQTGGNQLALGSGSRPSTANLGVGSPAPHTYR